MYCNPELRKAIAFSLFIKTRVKSSAVQRWSINKLHEITGVSACAVRKRIDTLKALGLVEFTGKNNRCLVFKSLKSHTSHRNVLVPNIEFISRNDSKKNAYAQNVKFIEDTLSAMLIIDVQNRKNYAKLEEHLDGKLNLETLAIEKQLEFKDGDIVVYGKSVAICRKIYKHTLSFYVSLNEMVGLLFADEVESSEEYRFATEEEKQQLFDALEKEGKAWDAEKKQIVDLKPKCEFKPFDRCIWKIRNCEGSIW